MRIESRAELGIVSSSTAFCRDEFQYCRPGLGNIVLRPMRMCAKSQLSGARIRCCEEMLFRSMHCIAPIATMWPPRHAPPASALDSLEFGLAPEGSFDESAPGADAAAFPGPRAGRAVEPELLPDCKRRIARPRIRHGALPGGAFAGRAGRRCRSREHSSQREDAPSIRISVRLTGGTPRLHTSGDRGKDPCVSMSPRTVSDPLSSPSFLWSMFVRTNNRRVHREHSLLRFGRQCCPRLQIM